MEKVHDVPLRAGVQPAGHLVAEEQLRVGNQLHRQAETAFLPAGEHLDAPVGDFRQPGFLEHAVDAGVQRLGVAAFNAQPGGYFDGFIDGQRVVGNRELRDIADFRRLEILVLREIPPFPEQRTG